MTEPNQQPFPFFDPTLYDETAEEADRKTERFQLVAGQPHGVAMELISMIDSLSTITDICAVLACAGFPKNGKTTLVPDPKDLKDVAAVEKTQQHMKTLTIFLDLLSDAMDKLVRMNHAWLDLGLEQVLRDLVFEDDLLGKNQDFLRKLIGHPCDGGMRDQKIQQVNTLLRRDDDDKPRGFGKPGGFGR